MATFVIASTYSVPAARVASETSMIQLKTLDLFAGIAVTDYSAALNWYEQLLGSAPVFFPHDTEAVWQLAEHRYLYIVQQPEHAGHARHTLFVDDLDAVVGRLPKTDSTPRNRKPIRTASARSRTAISTQTRSGSAAVRYPASRHQTPRAVGSLSSHFPDFTMVNFSGLYSYLITNKTFLSRSSTVAD
jgi:hypothetical protein